jgi:hypothetical protein
MKTYYWIRGVWYDLPYFKISEVILKEKLHNYGFRFSNKGKLKLLRLFEIDTKEELRAFSNVIVNSFDIKHIYKSHAINSRYKQRIQFSLFKHLEPYLDN